MTPFEPIQALDQPARREWLRAWMKRMGLLNPNQAAPVLCVVRTSLQRMISEPPGLPIADQTLKLAWALESLRLHDGALRTIVSPVDPNLEKSAMREGFYSVAYSGFGGSGFGMIVLTKGAIIGADAAGAVWDGRYTDEGPNGLAAEMAVTLPPNVISALTGRTSPGPHVERFAVMLPPDLGSERVIPVKTSLGMTINVALRKVRDLSV